MMNDAKHHRSVKIVTFVCLLGVIYGKLVEMNSDTQQGKYRYTGDHILEYRGAAVFTVVCHGSGSLKMSTVDMCGMAKQIQRREQIQQIVICTFAKFKPQSWI